MRPGFKLGALLFVVICLCAAVGIFLRTRSVNAVPENQASAAKRQLKKEQPAQPALQETDASRGAVKGESEIAPVASSTPIKTIQVEAPAAAVAKAQPTAVSRDLVNNLTANLPTTGLTQEHVAAWKQNLQQLVQQGASAVPAIREFLEKNRDLDFGRDGAQIWGYGSARSAMFDALQQIGGPEAVAASVDTLQGTRDPREIALLAASLEKQAPEQYRQEALSAARDALSLAASGKLEGRDVAPLFEVFVKYGDSSVASELQQSSKQWSYYATMSLAHLPDGAGIPSLVEMAQGTSGGSLNALQMLASLAPQSTEARAALLQEASANKITPYGWATLVSGLAGDEFHFVGAAFDNTGALISSSGVQTSHIQSGNQNFYSAPPAGGLTADQIAQRTTLLDELRSVTSNQSAIQALQQARDLLAKRSGQPVATAP
jgi:hypothetical protein